jgi:hypothetical protein
MYHTYNLIHIKLIIKGVDDMEKHEDEFFKVLKERLIEVSKMSAKEFSEWMKNQKKD